MDNQITQIVAVSRTFLAGFALILALARGHALANDGATEQIPDSTMQVISNGDSDAVIAEKAAKVLPRANQTDWMRLERTFFLHFGVNTFNEVEWGSGREEPSIFNPTALDANQWLGAVKNFGSEMIVLVSKHHDGFCYWPTRYTPHSVAASPWRGGKGDEVREVASAARANGVKLAVYLSPADLYQLRTNPKNPAGYYGNGSSNVLSVIPTDPASFQSDPSKGRALTPGFTDYSMANRTYRYFNGTPLYAFGHGLSYTKFDFKSGKMGSEKIPADGTAKVTFTMKNSGKCNGDEVAQVYFRHVNSAVPQPKLALYGFARVHLKRGESRKATIEVPVERLHYWSTEKKQYVVEPEDYEILIGAASDDIRLNLPITITAR